VGASVRRAAACSCQWVQVSGELQRAAVTDSGSLSRWACVCCSQQTAVLNSTSISAIRHDRPSKGSWKNGIPAQYSYWSQPRWLPPSSDMQWSVKTSVCRHLLYRPVYTVRASLPGFSFVLLAWAKHSKSCTHKHRTPLLSHTRTQQVADSLHAHSLHLLSAPWGRLVVRATLDLTTPHIPTRLSVMRWTPTVRLKFVLVFLSSSRQMLSNKRVGQVPARRSPEITLLIGPLRHLACSKCCQH